MEQYKESKRHHDQQRRDVAAMGWTRFAELFPEYVPDDLTPTSAEEIDRALGENEAGETEPVKFDFSHADDITEEQAAEALRELMADLSSGSVNLSEAKDAGWF